MWETCVVVISHLVSPILLQCLLEERPHCILGEIIGTSPSDVKHSNEPSDGRSGITPERGDMAAAWCWMGNAEESSEEATWMGTDSH